MGELHQKCTWDASNKTEYKTEYKSFPFGLNIILKGILELPRFQGHPHSHAMVFVYFFCVRIQQQSHLLLVNSPPKGWPKLFQPILHYQMTLIMVELTCVYYAKIFRKPITHNDIAKFHFGPLFICICHLESSKNHKLIDIKPLPANNGFCHGSNHIVPIQDNWGNE
jgi:hypothetical protein